MQDVIFRGKAFFWITVLATLALILVPSLALMDAVGGYLRFLLQWDPGTIPMTRTAYPLRHDVLGKPGGVQLRFVQFSLEAPKAAKVLVAGDFNDWQPEPLSQAQGRWELLLPLPPGRYQYSYLVDGAWTPDPAARESGVRGEIKTSIRQVP